MSLQRKQEYERRDHDEQQSESGESRLSIDTASPEYQEREAREAREQGSEKRVRLESRLSIDTGESRPSWNGNRVRLESAKHGKAKLRGAKE